MNTKELVDMVAELQVIADRAKMVEHAIMRGQGPLIEPCVRELARLVGGLADRVLLLCNERGPRD